MNTERQPQYPKNMGCRYLRDKEEDGCCEVGCMARAIILDALSDVDPSDITQVEACIEFITMMRLRAWVVNCANKDDLGNLIFLLVDDLV